MTQTLRARARVCVCVLCVVCEYSFNTHTGNQLTGTIPSEFAQLSNIYYLSFRMNSLSGTVPATFSRFSHLVLLYLYGNNLTGAVPTISTPLSVAWCDLARARCCVSADMHA
jgi:hypothetical protein